MVPSAAWHSPGKRKREQNSLAASGPSCNQKCVLPQTCSGSVGSTNPLAIPSGTGLLQCPGRISVFPQKGNHEQCSNSTNLSGHQTHNYFLPEGKTKQKNLHKSSWISILIFTNYSQLVSSAFIKWENTWQPTDLLLGFVWQNALEFHSKIGFFLLPLPSCRSLAAAALLQPPARSSIRTCAGKLCSRSHGLVRGARLLCALPPSLKPLKD